MAGRKSDFTLSTKSLDDLFSSQEERDEAKLAKIYDIPLELIDDFPDHPFKVRDDEDMTQLTAMFSLCQCTTMPTRVYSFERRHCSVFSVEGVQFTTTEVFNLADVFTIVVVFYRSAFVLPPLQLNYSYYQKHKQGTDCNNYR